MSENLWPVSSATPLHPWHQGRVSLATTPFLSLKFPPINEQSKSPARLWVFLKGLSSEPHSAVSPVMPWEKSQCFSDCEFSPAECTYQLCGVHFACHNKSLLPTLDVSVSLIQFIVQGSENLSSTPTSTRMPLTPTGSQGFKFQPCSWLYFLLLCTLRISRGC